MASKDFLCELCGKKVSWLRDLTGKKLFEGMAGDFLGELGGKKVLSDDIANYQLPMAYCLLPQN